MPEVDYIARIRLTLWRHRDRGDEWMHTYRLDQLRQIVRWMRQGGRKLGPTAARLAAMVDSADGINGQTDVIVSRGQLGLLLTDLERMAKK